LIGILDSTQFFKQIFLRNRRLLLQILYLNLVLLFQLLGFFRCQLIYLWVNLLWIKVAIRRIRIAPSVLWVFFRNVSFFYFNNLECIVKLVWIEIVPPINRNNVSFRHKSTLTSTVLQTDPTFTLLQRWQYLLLLRST
jgi:hypothetical protein